MRYYSLNTPSHQVSFQEAVIQGLAPDRGLYFPEQIRPIDIFKDIKNLSKHEIALQAIQQFVADEIPAQVLSQIVEETLDFDFPCVPIHDGVYSLELFHGPTLAFKDVGARFMARCLGYFNQNKQDFKTKVLVATSGDTGGAVANGFYNVPNVEVVILYPKGKVSDIQERQLTTLGANITALEVDGVFDDCQQMVKKAFLDEELKSQNLTSANSINVARWLPQLFYFLLAYKELHQNHPDLSFVVPSGNFGNICAGIVAHRLGMPVHHFVATTNINDTVPRYMQTAQYTPKPSHQTISNAMDVGDPSNFVRIQRLFENDHQQLKEKFISKSYTDEQTRQAMRDLYTKHQYIADPHGAVAYLGVQDYHKTYPDTTAVMLETAHPCKFLDVVEDAIQQTPPIPASVQKLMHLDKKSIPITNYKDLKAFLLD